METREYKTDEIVEIGDVVCMKVRHAFDTMIITHIDNDVVATLVRPHVQVNEHEVYIHREIVKVDVSTLRETFLIFVTDSGNKDNRYIS